MSNASTEMNVGQHELMNSARHYIHYLGGVTILNAPHGEFAQNILGEGDESLDDTAETAAGIMVHGLTECIRAVHPYATSQEKMAKNFDSAVAHLDEAYDLAYDLRRDQISFLNPGFFGYRPAPMLERIIYGHLLHPHVEKLTFAQLMDGVPISRQWGDLGQRKLQSARHYGPFAVRKARAS